MTAGPFSCSPEPVTRPRPGHADLAGGLKYDRHDVRDVLERASARETAARTAVGAVARKLLASVGVEVFAHVVALGPVEAPSFMGRDPHPLTAEARASDLACADPQAEAAMRQAIDEAAAHGDTLGGVFEVVATGVPVGLGSHVQWDRRLDGRLAQALMSIPAIKAVQVGDGIASARRPGSQVHDPIAYDADRRGFTRSTNRAGGVEGGMSTGEPVVCQAFMKPIATLRRPLASVDVVSKQAVDAAVERADVCAVAAASVVGEAMVALTLADALLEKHGGDSMRELLRNVAGFADQVRGY
jgi:chorismate synthase